MRVCIDAVPLQLRSAGIKNYLYHWIAHLRRLAGDQQILLFPPFGKPGLLDHEKSVFGGLSTLAGLSCLYAANHTPLPVLDYLSRSADLFHATNQVRNPPQKLRLTATIHDMTAWLLPGVHTAGNRQADSHFAECVLKRADGLIAVSENTRNDAVRILGLDPRKIEVIYSGVTEAFFQTSPVSAAAAAAKYRLQRPYILFVGTIEPRKNLDLLLDAYGELTASLREQFELAIAGPAGWADAKTLSRLRTGMPGVRLLGYIPEEDLPGLTAGATVFAYPSLYEGFGFPVAQAMAAGIAVLTSHTSALPEVVGDGAVLVDPHSTAEIRDGLTRMLLSPDLRDALGKKGRQRAACFRWERCAASSMDFFQRIAGG